MSRAATIAAQASGTYTVTRHGVGSYTGGIFTPAGSPTTFDIIAAIQPLSGRTLQELPEGYHADETRKVFTATMLTGMTPTNAPDQLSVDGVTWYVIKVSAWVAHNETHYEVIISRVLA